MTVYAPTQNAYTSVAGSQTVQVRNGRVRFAASATPAANDFLVLPNGAVMALDNGGYVQAVDEGAIVVGVDV